MTNDLKTVVGLFDDLGEARNAVQELTTQGYSRDDVNLIANASAEEYHRYFDKDGRFADTAAADTGSGAATGAGIGAVLGGLGGLVLGMSLLPIPGIGPIVAAGPITSALVGAVGGAIAGGLIGALTGIGVPDEHAHYYAEGVRRGGTLVIVKTTASRLDRASQILNNHHPVDVHERVSSWKQAGWSRFDDEAAPYTFDQIKAERTRYGTHTPASHAAGAVGGAAEGAVIGSVVPGVGTAAGAAVGGLTGAVASSAHPVGTAGGAAAGAAGGAAVGSVVPGIGTAAGAVVGGVAGAIGGHEAGKRTNPQPADRR